MSPKGRKSQSGSWYNCELCGITLTQKDMHQHSCPPDLKSWDCSFIKDQILYGYIETVDISDAPDVGVEEKHFFAFISQSAMQLCNFMIGEDILVSIDSHDTIVRKVWPTTGRSLLSVTISKEITPGSKRSSVENNRVKLQKLSRKPLPASFIKIVSKEDISMFNEQHLLTLCKQRYTKKLLKHNMKLSIQFYGKHISFIVKEIKTNLEDDLLTDGFERLSTEDTVDRDSFYMVMESTDWDIVLGVGINKKIEDEDSNRTINFSRVGGYKEIKEELLGAVCNEFEKKETNCASSMGILLYGPNGVGKTFLVQALANEVNAHVVKINSGELYSKFYGETERRLKTLFMEAKQKPRSVILIDNVDTLCPKQGGTDQERRVITYLLTLIDSVRNSRVVVVAMTSQISLVDTSLRRPGRLEWEIELHVPTVDDRCEILTVLLSGHSIDCPDIMRVAAACHGYVAADLECLVSKARMQAANENKPALDISNLLWALSQVKPSAMREVLIQVPDVKWSDIGGMDDLKLKLKQAIEWPLTHPEVFPRLGISPPRGVLMYGPPGCSKTMIAKALATESKLNFLSIKGSELFSKWVGESEKAVQSLFRKARSVAPSIVFLDELDAIGGERSGSTEGSNVQERVLAQLLTEMDGVEPLGNVNIVAATNRPDRVDKALVRPGRLDRLVYVPLPDRSTRQCILQLRLAKMPTASDVHVEELAMKTEGYSGAEVVAVCHEAAINALQEDFNVTEVCERHFLSALETVKPRTPSSLLKLYDVYQQRE